MIKLCGRKKLAGINSSSTLTNLLELNNFILAEKDYKVAVKKIIEFAQSVCNADGYLLYIINDDDFLSLEYTHVDSLGFDKSGSDNMTIYPTVYIPDLRNKELKSLAETSALNHELINTSNIYASTDFDNSISKWFDQEYNYRIVSCLTLPILNRKKNIISIAQFFNAKDDNGKTISVTPEVQRFTQAICSLAGLVQRQGEGLLLHGALRLLPGGLPKGVIRADEVEGAGQRALPFLLAHYIGVSGQGGRVCKGHRLTAQFFCCHGVKDLRAVENQR